MLRVFIAVWVSIALWAGANDDAAIQARLKSKMERSKLRADGLKFKVQDGMVEWTGSVRTAQRKGAATRMAKTAGAKRVLNRIVVQQGPNTGLVKTMPRQANVQVRSR